MKLAAFKRVRSCEDIIHDSKIVHKTFPER